VPGQSPVGLFAPSSVSAGSDMFRKACCSDVRAARVVEFEDYVKRTVLRYKGEIAEAGKEKFVPELLVYVDTRPDKPLRLDEQYLRDKSEQASHTRPAGRPGELGEVEVSEQSCTLDTTFSEPQPKHIRPFASSSAAQSTSSSLNFTSFLHRGLGVAALVVCSLRDGLAALAGCRSISAAFG
jgi:hypothetical protein